MANLSNDGKPCVRDSKGRFAKGNRTGGQVGGVRAELRDIYDKVANKKKFRDCIQRLFEIALTGKDRDALVAIKMIEERCLGKLKTQQNIEIKTDESSPNPNDIRKMFYQHFTKEN